MSEPYKIKVTDLIPDQRNLNAGTERGKYMLDKSVETLGAGRSMVIDEQGNLVAGNKTQEALVEAGIEDVIVVPTDGKTAVAVQRTDWNLYDEDPNNPARQYSVVDNRSSEVGFEIDPEMMEFHIEQGVDFRDWYTDIELQTIRDEFNRQNGIPPLQDWPDYDESVEDDVKYHKCPECGHKWAK